MTDYIFDFTKVDALTKEKPKSAIILCHGYGGDGKDISSLAIHWQRFLPETVFFCPNAPEICAINPKGFQWFDLTIEKEDVILEKSILAEKKLILFLNQITNHLKLESENLALVGFSQGCMISLQAGLKYKKKISCIIGYSGKIINQKHLSENINSKPKIFIMHGENDAIVSPTHLLESKEYLVKHEIKVKTKLFKDCEHGIPVEGTSLGLDFLKKNLL